MDSQPDIIYEKLVSKTNTRSWVWQHFAYAANNSLQILNNDWVVCRYCKIFVKKINTTNLIAHLANNHAEVFPKKPSASEKNTPHKLKKRRITEVSEVSDISTDENTNDSFTVTEIDDVVNKTLLDNDDFDQNQSFEDVPAAPRMLTVMEVLQPFLIIDLVDLQVENGKGFQTMFKTLVPGLQQLPSVSEVFQNFNLLSTFAFSFRQKM